MKNKTLEKILIKNNHTSVVSLLENCENGRIIEIRVNKESGITKDEKIDKKLYNYLKKLKIKVIFLQELAKDVEQSRESGASRFYKKQPMCSGMAHDIISDAALTTKERLELLEQGKHARFRIDDQSFVHCNDCNGILKISLEEGNGQ